MTQNTVLVTGGAGYVGSHTCKALARSGYFPVTYDNLSRGHEWAVRWGPLERGDILDKARLQAVLRQHKPLAVLHFAAFAYVGESVEQPEMYYENNVTGALTLLEAMLSEGIKQIIFSSTCATYGIPDMTPITEDHPQRPISPYGRSKLIIEQALTDCRAAYGLQSCALRYFNAAGADPESETGEDHDPEPHLIPNVLSAAAGDIDELMVFGEDYPTPDGTCIRDYIHVSDLADAHVLALQRLGSGIDPQLNLGTGRGHSVREIIEAAEAVTRRTVPAHVTARRPGDPPTLVAGADRAREQLGWEPRYTDIKEILRTAWMWHQRREGG